MASEKQLREADYVWRGDDGEYCDDIGQCGFTCDHSEIRKDNATGKNYRYCVKLQMKVFDYDSCKYYSDDEQADLLGQLGTMIIRSDNTSKNENELLEAAKENDKYAIYELARRYEQKGDYSTAINFYSRASELGDIDAPLNIARILDGKKQYKEAASFFQLSVERTNAPIAHTTLAKYYVMGFIGNVFTRKKKAFEHFLAAAKQGNAEAQYFTALAYGEGQGVGKSISEYIFWLRCSQLNGYPKAVNRLNVCLSDRQYLQAWKEELAKADQKISKNQEYIEDYIRRQIKKK